jgi:hypothetical protein
MHICIALPGHSITEEHATLRSAGLYQEVSFPSPGKEFPFVRTGIERNLTGDEQTAYLAGQRQVVAAGARCYKLLRHAGYGADFLLAAGRPPYIDKITDDPLVSEGSVMERELRESVGYEVAINVHNKTLTTGDDARSIIGAAASDRYDNVVVVMMAFRIGRFEALLQELSIELRSSSWMEHIRVMPAEAFSDDPASFLAMSLSNAYAQTMRNERFSVLNALLTGHTATTGGKT